MRGNTWWHNPSSYLSDFLHDIIIGSDIRPEGQVCTDIQHLCHICPSVPMGTSDKMTPGENRKGARASPLVSNSCLIYKSHMLLNKSLHISLSCLLLTGWRNAVSTRPLFHKINIKRTEPLRCACDIYSIIIIRHWLQTDISVGGILFIRLLKHFHCDLSFTSSWWDHDQLQWFYWSATSMSSHITKSAT